MARHLMIGNGVCEWVYIHTIIYYKKNPLFGKDNDNTTVAFRTESTIVGMMQ